MKHFKKNKLLPSDKHTIYSFRHSFKDRLKAVEAPEELIAEIRRWLRLKAQAETSSAIALTPPLRVAA
jgi:hypothetical protein